MTDGRRPREDDQSAGRRYAFPVTIAAVALLAVSMIRHGSADHGPPQPAAGQAPAATASGPVGPGGADDPDGTGAAEPDPVPSGPPPPLDFSAPTEVRIPALRVDAPVTTVDAEPDGELGAPPEDDKNLAGWFPGSPAPGERGTAIIDGHVDNMRGPAVFYGLGALRKGNHVEVVRTDGRTAVFTIYGIQVFAKNDFPGERVYAGTGRPELRVITCGGGFTRKNGYDSNVVVFARLSAVE